MKFFLGLNFFDILLLNSPNFCNPKSLVKSKLQKPWDVEDCDEDSDSQEEVPELEALLQVAEGQEDGDVTL